MNSLLVYFAIRFCFEFIFLFDFFIYLVLILLSQLKCCCSILLHKHKTTSVYCCRNRQCLLSLNCRINSIYLLLSCWTMTIKVAKLLYKQPLLTISKLLHKHSLLKCNYLTKFITKIEILTLLGY